MTVIIDPASRVRDLMDASEGRINREFLRAVVRAQNLYSVDELEELIRNGNTDEFLKAIETFIAALAAAINNEYIAAVTSSVNYLVSQGANMALDITRFRLVQHMSAERLRLVQGLTFEQRSLYNRILQDGLSGGVNPRQTAIRLRSSLGLTQRQYEAVLNYERLLRSNSASALRRQLRDKRFDPTIRRAIRDNTPLTEDQIQRMVGRYRERYTRYRSEVIARTESLRAVNAANWEAYQQAIDQGVTSEDKLTRTWNTASDNRVRDSHGDMQGQERKPSEPFRSGNGNELLYPGDPRAPITDTAQCRCAVATRMEIE